MIGRINIGLYRQHQLNTFYSAVEFALHKHSNPVPVTALRPDSAGEPGIVDEEIPVAPISRIPSLSDLLRYFIIQILWQTKPVQTELTLSWICNQYRGATTEEELWSILGHAISYMRRNVTIIVDLDLLGPLPGGCNDINLSETGWRFVGGCRKLLLGMVARNVRCQLTVMLVSHQGSDCLFYGWWGRKGSKHHRKGCRKVQEDRISRAEYERLKQLNDSAYTDLLSPIDPNIFAS